MIRHCYSCADLCDHYHYLCRACWRTLSAETRRRLRLKDSMAGTRLIELLRQVHNEIPLEEIEVRP